MSNPLYSGFMDELIKISEESVLSSILMSPVRATANTLRSITDAVKDEAKTKIFGLGERIGALAGKPSDDPMLHNVLLRGRLQGKSADDLQKMHRSVVGMRRHMAKMPADTAQEFKDLLDSFGEGKAGQAFGRAALERGVVPMPTQSNSSLLPLLGLSGLGLAAAIAAYRSKKKSEEKAKDEAFKAPPTSSDQG